MARPVDPSAQYRIKPHVTNGYTYASTQPPQVDPDTGKKTYHYIHWGKVDADLKFIPGTQFYAASPEERARLIFPEDWDMSAAEKLTGMRKPGRPSYDEECQNRLYGDIWLLEQVAVATGIRQDLEKVFHGNCERVDDIMTLAMFPYLTKYTYNRVERWQRVAGAPSTRELTPTEITRLTQSITEQHRMDLLRLRTARMEKDEVCAVDTTSRSAYGSGLADIHWGKNKEGLSLEQTTEVVVYSLSKHMPVYYRSCPGNMPDSRGFDIILADLDHAGFKDAVLLTDRGYDSLRNMEKYILQGRAMIMCAKTNQLDVSKAIDELGELSFRPDGMQVDPEARIYYKQCETSYEVKSIGNTTKAADRLKINLYFDPVRRGAELMDLDIKLSQQEAALNELLKDGASIVDDIAALKRDCRYYKLTLDTKTKAVISFELDEKKVAKVRKLAGFFAIKTHRLDLSAMEVLHTYHLRDEQEKYFQQMKDQMGGDRQRSSSEEGKAGRDFIQFVGLILSSYVRYIWKITVLKEMFSSSLEVLDEMRTIRLIEHTNHAKIITPFVGAQVDICKAFDFQIPQGCAPLYPSRKKLPQRRGRPPKTRVEFER